jgi:hypothetical protein
VTGASTIPVKNINSFTTSWAYQIGKTGEEEAEIIAAGTPSGTTILSGTIKYDHPIDTPIYNVHYDKFIVKRSTVGTSGTAIALTNGTISITPDSLYTEYDDTTGATTYAYKVQLYNSVSTDISAESDWITPGGPTFYSMQKLRQRIKDGIYNPDYIKSDSVVDDWINECLEEMNNAAIKVNQDYLLGTASYSFGTAGLGTVTASDFMYPRKFEVTYDGVSYGTASKLNINEYDDNTVFGGAIPRYSWQGDTVFQILPKGSGGTARITYSKGEAILDNETDELPYPMRRYSRAFIYYGRAMAYENDQKDSTSETNYQKFLKVKSDFINEITPRDQTGVQHIQYVEALSGDNSGEWDEIY